jgi:hypothetical protein
MEFVACMGEMIIAEKFVVDKYFGKRKFGRSWPRWESNKIYFIEILCEAVDLICLINNRGQ